MFTSIFEKDHSVVGVTIVLALVVVLSLIYAFSYIFIKRRTFYFRDMPISFVIVPVVVATLTMAADTIMLAYTGTNDAARYGRVVVALLSALLILKIRSEPRGVDDITYLFFSIAYAMFLGMGYVAYAVIIYVLGLALVIGGSYLFSFLDKNNKLLKVVITMPEDLDFDEALKEVFFNTTTHRETLNVKLTDMGSLYKVTYNVELKKGISIKEFIDQVRVRNGNLNVSVTLHRDFKD